MESQSDKSVVDFQSREYSQKMQELFSYINRIATEYEVKREVVVDEVLNLAYRHEASLKNNLGKSKENFTGKSSILFGETKPPMNITYILTAMAILGMILAVIYLTTNLGR